MPPTIDEALAKVDRDHGISLIPAPLAKTTSWKRLPKG